VSRVKDMSNMFHGASVFNQTLCWKLWVYISTDYMFSNSGTTYAAAIKNPACPFITDSASLETAIGMWCQNLAQATGIYGDISTWCVFQKHVRRMWRFLDCLISPSHPAPPRFPTRVLTSNIYFLFNS